MPHCPFHRRFPLVLWDQDLPASLTGYKNELATTQLGNKDHVNLPVGGLIVSPQEALPINRRFRHARVSIAIF